MACPYCSDTNYTLSFLPSTRFNNKLFRYLSCAGCGVMYLDPLPSSDDYQKMYPTDYQGGADKTLLKNQYEKLPGLRTSYGIQFDAINKYSVKNPRVMDYGCGNANFIINASYTGLTCEGAEFNEEHVKTLRKEIPSVKFYTISEMLSHTNDRYDVIRMSNVLEHLYNPNEIIGALMSKLNEKGLFVIEGPVECNSNFAFFTRKLYFKWMNFIRKGYVSGHLPTHITFTNAKNQLSFFEKFNLESLEYKITESEWPYPASFSEARGLSGKVKACIARISIFLSSLTNTWGNTFLYVGRKR
ncbi:MAG: class I SAM-dependent methyltransferase [Bacteroidetes bacterium]|nr:class I SAM-dependent methyltransferase [Bacteroidota bacterium]